MKRVAIRLIAGCLWAVTPLFAQGGASHSLRLNGYGGFGYGFTGIQSGPAFESNYRDLSSELGLDGSGFLYDPRLLNYSLSTYWDGNNTAIDQGSARSNGLAFSGGLSLLSQRSFPLTFYFARTRSNTSGSLIPAFATENNIWGLRGELKQPWFALINYNVGIGKTENDLPSGEEFNTRHRFADLSATRKLRGWELRFGDDFIQTKSTFSNFLDRNNTLSFDASHSFNDRVRLALEASHSAFSFKDLSGASSSDSGVTLLNGNLTWNHTERLDSFYSFNIARNAVNVLRLLAAANGDPGVALPFNAQSLKSTSGTASAGTSYRPTPNLSANASLTYSHNALPAESLASLPPNVRNTLTTGLVNGGAGYSYRRKIWKLEAHNASSLDGQHFNLLGGSSESGLGYSLDNGVTGGDVRKLRFGGSYRYSRRSNPVFFNVVTTSDNRGTIKLESEYLRFVTFQGLADIGTTKLDLAGSRINLDTTNYTLSTTFPRRRLTLFASRGVSNSLERFLGLDSILFEPGGSTGSLPIPGGLLNPLIYSDVLSERAGVIWRPRFNLQFEGRYSRNRYLFTFLNETENRYRQFDVSVQYKFGRFTIITGYARASGEALRFNQDVNRFFFRVRFPFHVLG